MPFAMRQGLRPAHTREFRPGLRITRGQSWRSLSPELGGVTTVPGAAPGQQWRPHSGLSCSDRALRTFHLNHTDKAHHQELMLLSVQLITDHFFKK